MPRPFHSYLFDLVRSIDLKAFRYVALSTPQLPRPF